MRRGVTTKQEDEHGQTLSRALITRRYELAHATASCLGCGLCADVCPQDAVELQPAAVANGRLQRRPRPVLTAARCNFCGECAIVCPSHSLRLVVDGAARLSVVEAGAFPTLLAAVAVDLPRCRAGCGLACQKECPVEAVAVDVEEVAGGGERIAAVAVDGAKCFYCGLCEIACPEGAVAVSKPFAGALKLAAVRCPSGCRACADACPSSAIRAGDAGALTIDERSCFYCGACARVCPVAGALAVRRNQVRHSEVKSAAWTAALAKVLSPAAQAREMDAKARRRAREAAAGLLGVGK